MRSSLPVVVVAIVALLGGCSSADAPLPQPTQGAAWGGTVIPYDSTLTLTGGMELESSIVPAKDEPPQPIAVLEVQPGDAVNLSVRFTNDTGIDLVDVRVRITAGAFKDQLPGNVEITEVNGDGSVIVDAVALEAMHEREGLRIGTIAVGKGATVSTTMVAPTPAECGSTNYDIWIGVADASTGDRNHLKSTIEVVGEPC